MVSIKELTAWCLYFKYVECYLLELLNQFIIIWHKERQCYARSILFQFL